MPIEGIDAFEVSNCLAVNVFELGGDRDIYPLRTSTYENARDTIDLLLLEEGDQQHYVLITDLEKLLQHTESGKSSFVPLPKHIADKKACVNIQCCDEKNFKWCILAAKYGTADDTDRQLVNKYWPYRAEFDNYRYPMEHGNIRHFEKKERIAVNVYYITEAGVIDVLRVSELLPNDPTVQMHVDLLLVESHYILIRNFSRLVTSQVTANSHTHFACRRCLHLCTSERVLQKHMERCVQHKAQSVKMPEPTDENPEVTMHYSDIEKQLPLPFWFVADFESILKPIDLALGDVPAPDCPIRDEDGQLRFSKFRNVDNPDEGLRPTSSTTRIQEHEACGFAYQLLSTDPRFYEPPVVVRGENCAKEFLDRLQADAKRVRGWLKNPEPMPKLTDQQEADFQAATHCWICEKEYEWFDDLQARDHCHITGVYRGSAHHSCNLNYRINPDEIEIPCFLHNLKSYDAHLIIAAAEKEHGDITAIPSNTEKYISFKIGDVQFKDSFAFMQASLDSLVSDLKPEELVNTRRYLEMTVHSQRGEDDRFSARSEEDETPDSDDDAFIDDAAMPELCYDSDEEDYGALVGFLLDPNSSKVVHLVTHVRDFFILYISKKLVYINIHAYLAYYYFNLFKFLVN